MISKFKQDKGFTVLELVIGLVIMSVVSAAAYRVYQTQKKVNDVQEQLIELNQNLRAAMFYIEDELKTAGCDPTGRANAGLLEADTSQIRFTRDVTGGEQDSIDNDGDGDIDELLYDGEDNDGDGLVDGDDPDERYATEWFNGSTADPGEDITYSLADAYSDGDTDLVRKSGGGNNQPVVENVDALDFVYLDGNGNVLGPLPLDATGRGMVRSVEVSLITRARRPDLDFTDSQTYYNMRGTEILPAPNDHYHRKLISITVKCRNLGLL